MEDPSYTTFLHVFRKLCGWRSFPKMKLTNNATYFTVAAKHHNEFMTQEEVLNYLSEFEQTGVTETLVLKHCDIQGVMQTGDCNIEVWEYWESHNVGKERDESLKILRCLWEIALAGVHSNSTVGLVMLETGPYS